jgi:hypothetical protein
VNDENEIFNHIQHVSEVLTRSLDLEEHEINWRMIEKALIIYFQEDQEISEALKIEFNSWRATSELISDCLGIFEDRLGEGTKIEDLEFWLQSRVKHDIFVEKDYILKRVFGNYTVIPKKNYRI